MKKKLKSKFEIKKIYDDLKIIDFKLTDLTNRLTYLKNYCQAYSFKHAVYYFTPFSKLLEDDAKKISKNFYKILSDSDKSSFNDDTFLKNIKPLNFDEIIIED